MSLDVSATGTIADVTVELEIAHRCCPSLDVVLKAPDGTCVTLLSGVGRPIFDPDDSSPAIDAVFDDEAPFPIDRVAAREHYTGSYRPPGTNASAFPLSRFDGKAAAGEWRLIVTNYSAFAPVKQGDYAVVDVKLHIAVQ